MVLVVLSAITKNWRLESHLIVKSRLLIFLLSIGRHLVFKKKKSFHIDFQISHLPVIDYKKWPQILSSLYARPLQSDFAAFSIKRYVVCFPNPSSLCLAMCLALTNVTLENMTQEEAWKVPVPWGLPSLAALGKHHVNKPRLACWVIRDM